jgi:hypothetical protein
MAYSFFKKHLGGKSINLTFAAELITGLWCKGSTTDFDSVCQGSNPCNPTKRTEQPVLFLFLAMGPYFDKLSRGKEKINCEDYVLHKNPFAIHC